MSRKSSGLVRKELGACRPARKQPITTRSLIDRLWEKVDRIAPTLEDPDPCWPWLAGKSKSGRRKILYGVIWRSGPRRGLLRAHRLVLLLETAGNEPELEERTGETPDQWLDRAIRFYQDLEAAHQCDNSICCRPAHLQWETHQENLSRQREREHQARLVASAAEMPQAEESNYEDIGNSTGAQS